MIQETIKAFDTPPSTVEHRQIRVSRLVNSTPKCLLDVNNMHDDPLVHPFEAVNLAALPAPVLLGVITDLCGMQAGLFMELFGWSRDRATFLTRQNLHALIAANSSFDREIAESSPTDPNVPF